MKLSHSCGNRLKAVAHALAPWLVKAAKALHGNAESAIQLIGVAVVLYGVSRWSVTATAILGGSGAILVPELRPIMVVWLNKWARL